MNRVSWACTKCNHVAQKDCGPHMHSQYGNCEGPMVKVWMQTFKEQEQEEFLLDHLLANLATLTQRAQTMQDALHTRTNRRGLRRIGS